MPTKPITRRKAPALTPLEMTDEEVEFAEKFAKRLGYAQTAYTSSSGLWGVFCIGDRPGHREGCVILTQEFGFMFVQDVEDCHFAGEALLNESRKLLSSGGL